jgi:FkbM family methyltransferase
MRRIFLDIGSHVGQSIEEAIKPEHGFDIVYGFEPITECCYEITKNYANERLIVNNFGLAKEDCTLMLYGVETLGASIYEDKNPEYEGRIDMNCYFKDIAKWFEDNINSDDYVVVKINAEGAECDIIERLCESNEYDKINKILVDFDCIKIESQKHRKPSIENLMSQRNASYLTSFPHGNTHQDRIKNFIR